jgi:serine/threonine protein kinase
MLADRMTNLCKGNISVVKLTYHVPTLTCVDVKLLRNMKYTSFISSEVNIMKFLTNPNIIKLFHLVQRRITTYLVMEQAS